MIPHLSTSPRLRGGTRRTAFSQLGRKKILDRRRGQQMTSEDEHHQSPMVIRLHLGHLHQCPSIQRRITARFSTSSESPINIPGISRIEMPCCRTIGNTTRTIMLSADDEACVLPDEGISCRRTVDHSTNRLAHEQQATKERCAKSNDFITEAEPLPGLKRLTFLPLHQHFIKTSWTFTSRRDDPGGHRNVKLLWTVQEMKDV